MACSWNSSRLQVRTTCAVGAVPARLLRCVPERFAVSASFSLLAEKSLRYAARWGRDRKRRVFGRFVAHAAGASLTGPIFASHSGRVFCGNLRLMVAGVLGAILIRVWGDRSSGEANPTGADCLHGDPTVQLHFRGLGFPFCKQRQMLQ